MRITTLNLQGMVGWDLRLPRLVAHLRDVDPDALLLQEVVYLPQISPWTNADLLNRELGYPHRHIPVTRLQAASGDGSPYREGLAILSRHPVLSTETLSLLRQEGDPHQRIVQLADVEAPDGFWRLGNVHLSVRDDFALTQAKELLALLDARGEQRVLAGDFNVNHLERHLARWRADGYRVSTDLEQYDSHPGTVETDDYVLVPAGTRITGIRVSPDGLSDHRGVTVDLVRA